MKFLKNANIVYIALGSNVGIREQNLKNAVNLVSKIENTVVIEVSNIYETAPVGYTQQDSFLNMAIKIKTKLSPVELLTELQNIELELKRKRLIRWGPRTIDLDILLFQNVEMSSEKLTIPHPRMFDRAFVLVPLCDIFSDEIIKLDSLAELARVCEDFDEVKLYKTGANIDAIENIKPIIGSKIINFEELTSTNDYTKILAKEGAKEGTTVIATRQTKGRGRMGRSWDSFDENGIWLSVLLRPKIEPKDIGLLTLIFAVCVVEAIFKITNVKCGIKWPNDIILEGKKVCGILCESSFGGENCDYVIVGMGINVNQQLFDENLKNIAISLKMHLNITYDKIEIINEVLRIADIKYKNFCSGNIAQIVSLYREYCINMGQKVKIQRETEEVLCYAIDINEAGNLIVRQEDGKVEEIVSGEVSIRGVYNYV